jgi:exonuclease SbcC
LMTGGRFARLLVDSEDDKPVLLAQPDQGKAVSVSALSEGTADQLYLALRLAALEVQRSPERVMPLVLDDVFMTADDERAVNMFKALERFSAQTQVLVFTHHRHLTDIAERTVRSGMLCTHQLQARS